MTCSNVLDWWLGRCSELRFPTRHLQTGDRPRETQYAVRLDCLNFPVEGRSLRLLGYETPIPRIFDRRSWNFQNVCNGIGKFGFFIHEQYVEAFACSKLRRTAFEIDLVECTPA